MRYISLLSISVLLSALPVRAQAIADWQRVQRIPVGTPIHVHAASGSRKCTLVTSDADSLTCKGPRSLFQHRESYTFSRSDVHAIRGSRQALSMLTGTAIGLGAGIGIGAGLDTKGGDDPHLAAALFGLLGGSLGLAIGSGSDFLAGPVLYQR